MRLGSLLERLTDARLVGSGASECEISDVGFDSRHRSTDSLFCCVPGVIADGHDHAAEAIANGAVALLVERTLELDVPQVVVRDVRAAMATAAAAVNGDPSRSMTVVGVTGTNGKTTTTHLVRNVLLAAGRRVEVLGTLSGTRTTPEAPELQRRLAQWRDEGVDVVAMEVSSHALDLHRVDEVGFDVAVFTNLSRDHLDHHRTMEDYFAAKARLFTPEFSQRAVVDLDDTHGRLLVDAQQIPTDGYSLDEARITRRSASSTSFAWRGLEVELPLGGDHNVANALAAAHVGLVLGVDEATIVAGLSTPLVVPGRFEPVLAGQPFDVVVDYAHTPDGLEHVLAAADAIATGRVIIVFGCGGDRDITKRPLMGEVAAQGADVVVVTADNSRSESTDVIITAITEGIDRADRRRATEVIVEPDRRQAIAAALRLGRTGDVVLVAGKGHETTQILGATVTEFDDRVVVAEEWARMGTAA